MGGKNCRVEKLPGPQVGVHLWEVSAYECSLVDVRLYVFIFAFVSKIISLDR